MEVPGSSIPTGSSSAAPTITQPAVITSLTLAAPAPAAPTQQVVMTPLPVTQTTQTISGHALAPQQNVNTPVINNSPSTVTLPSGVDDVDMAAGNGQVSTGTTNPAVTPAMATATGDPVVDAALGLNGSLEGETNLPSTQDGTSTETTEELIARLLKDPKKDEYGLLDH
ncbi:hypothetical protein K474DRAFT_1669483 [Panus rudis PR-1116 ss-1]|nr:hypothetical protein K474DRAFT_1669483 [Panus rudis PR-1116 ss-1]